MSISDKSNRQCSCLSQCFCFMHWRVFFLLLLLFFVLKNVSVFFLLSPSLFASRRFFPSVNSIVDRTLEETLTFLHLPLVLQSKRKETREREGEGKRAMHLDTHTHAFFSALFIAIIKSILIGGICSTNWKISRETVHVVM